MAGERSRWWRNLNQLALLGLIAVTAGLLLRPSDDEALLGLPQLTAGARPSRAVKAPRDFVLRDPETTARLRLEASSRVLPIYDFDTSAGREARSRLERAFAEKPAPPAPNIKLDRSAVESFMRALELYLDDAELEAVIQGGFSDQLRDAAIMVVRTIHESRIAADRDLLRMQAPQGITLQVLDLNGDVDHEEHLTDVRAVLGIDQAKAAVDELVARALDHLSPQERRSVALLGKRLLRPNLVPNPDETRLRRERAEEAVRMVVIPIQRGETVLRAEETATERQILIVNGMAAVLGAESRLQRPIGSVLLAVLLVILAYRTTRTRTFRPTPRDLGLMTSAYLMTLLATWMAYKGAPGLGELWPNVPASAWRAAVPVAAGPLMLRFLIGRAPAHAFAALAAVTCGVMMDNSLDHAILVLTGGMAASVVNVDAERPALGIIVGGLLAGLMEAAVLSALTLLGSRWDVDAVLVASMFALGSGILAMLIVLALVPICEALFGYTSPLKLRELSSLNHPLLRELLVQAPGTYHHSIVVGALAEAAARAIGADPSLARVGGYYHDIGKLKNPRFFAENQRPRLGDPFAEHSPVMVEDEAAIRAHVAEGLELGAQHRLGAPVLDILVQHHGTSEVRTLGRVSMRPGDVPARYAGPRPQTREAAMVMLADRVEAAAEALLAAPPIEEGMLEATVARVFHDAIADDQLAECPLTLSDLSAVEREMVKVLRDILTRRGAPAGVLLADPTSPVYVVPPSAGRPN